jgi:hypothetical protein
LLTIDFLVTLGIVENPPSLDRLVEEIGVMPA